MTINSPAAILLAFYVCVGEQQGVPRDRAARDGADGHPQGVHRAEGVHLPARAVAAARHRHDRVVRRASCRRWHPVSISGYHIREAGSTAAQELAFTLADGFTYVERALERGLDVDEFAPRLSFFFNAHLDFFEEIAKYRAARRIWARELRDRFGAKDDRVAADALPHADGRRVADRAAARGEHRAHGDRGARRGARRHAVAAHELVRRGARAAERGRRADRAADAAGDRPRDGRRQHDRPARRLVLRRAPDERARARRPTSTSSGSRSSAGCSPAIEQNFFQREIADAAFRYQREVESGERVVVGVNRYAARATSRAGAAARSTRRSSAQQIERVAALRGPARRGRGRGGARAAEARRRRRDVNLMPAIVDAARAVRDDRRDVRRAARGVGRLARDAHVLTPAGPGRVTTGRGCRSRSPSAWIFTKRLVDFLPMCSQAVTR